MTVVLIFFAGNHYGSNHSLLNLLYGIYIGRPDGSLRSSEWRGAIWAHRPPDSEAITVRKHPETRGALDFTQGSLDN
jgi:hypothetical protein